MFVYDSNLENKQLVLPFDATSSKILSIKDLISFVEDNKVQIKTEDFNKKPEITTASKEKKYYNFLKFRKPKDDSGKLHNYF